MAGEHQCKNLAICWTVYIFALEFLGPHIIHSSIIRHEDTEVGERRIPSLEELTDKEIDVFHAAEAGAGWRYVTSLERRRWSPVEDSRDELSCSFCRFNIWAFSYLRSLASSQKRIPFPKPGLQEGVPGLCCSAARVQRFCCSLLWYMMKNLHLGRSLDLSTQRAKV